MVQELVIPGRPLSLRPCQLSLEQDKHVKMQQCALDITLAALLCLSAVILASHPILAITSPTTREHTTHSTQLPLSYVHDPKHDTSSFRSALSALAEHAALAIPPCRWPLRSGRRVTVAGQSPSAVLAASRVLPRLPPSFPPRRLPPCRLLLHPLSSPLSPAPPSFF